MKTRRLNNGVVVHWMQACDQLGAPEGTESFPRGTQILSYA